MILVFLVLFFSLGVVCFAGDVFFAGDCLASFFAGDCLAGFFAGEALLEGELFLLGDLVVTIFAVCSDLGGKVG